MTTNLMFHDAYKVSATLAELDVIGVVRDAFLEHAAGTTQLPEEASIYWEAPDGGTARSIAMHAALPATDAHGPRVGAKLINGAINNPSRGLPRAEGIVALFDPLRAHITDILPAAEISATRTAAVSALASIELANPNPQRLAVIGAGPLGRKHTQMLIGAHPTLARVNVYDVDSTRAGELSSLAGSRQARVCGSAREAIEGADIVVCATTVTEPYVARDWLAPGSVTLNVSLDDLEAEVFLGADRVYVDDWPTVVGDQRRMLGRLAAEGKIADPGQLAPPGGCSVTGQLGEVIAGMVSGRTDEKECIVFNPFGLGIFDVALATAVVRAGMSR